MFLSLNYVPCCKLGLVGMSAGKWKIVELLCLLSNFRLAHSKIRLLYTFPDVYNGFNMWHSDDEGGIDIILGMVQGIFIPTKVGKY